MSSTATDDRARQEISALREMVEVYSRLSGLATQDTDLRAVVDLIVGRLGGSATVVDTDRQVIAASGHADEPWSFEAEPTEGRAALDRLIDAATRTRRSLTIPATSPTGASVVVAPIVLGDELVAHLLTAATGSDERAEDIRLMVTEHAAMVCAILLGRARVVAAAAGQARRDLFEGILLPDRNPADVENWARHLGIKPDGPHRVVTLLLGSEARPTVTSFTERYLNNRAPEATVMARGDELVAVVPESLPEPRGLESLVALARSCKKAVESRFKGVTVAIGVGNSYEGAEQIARSYAEAKRALDTGRMLSGLGGVVVFGDLGIHRLLVRVRDVADLRDFARDVLGSLMEQDANNGTDYLTTLTVYFHENNSPQRTARRLHMHPNTVAYRIRRVEEITGKSLGAYPDRLLIQVALEITNGLGELPWTASSS